VLDLLVYTTLLVVLNKQRSTKVMAKQSSKGAERTDAWIHGGTDGPAWSVRVARGKALPLPRNGVRSVLPSVPEATKGESAHPIRIHHGPSVRGSKPTSGQVQCTDRREKGGDRSIR
jgi:hypothetical protein